MPGSRGLVGWISLCDWQGQVDFGPNPAATECPILWFQHPVWKSVQDQASRSRQRGEDPRALLSHLEASSFRVCVGRNPVRMSRFLKWREWRMTDQHESRQISTKNPFKSAEEGSISPFRVPLDPINLHTLLKRQPQSPKISINITNLRALPHSLPSATATGLSEGSGSAPHSCVSSIWLILLSRQPSQQQQAAD